MSTPSPLDREEYLLKIQRHLEFVARVADTRPELSLSDVELERIEKTISRLVTGIEEEKKKE